MSEEKKENILTRFVKKSKEFIGNLKDSYERMIPVLSFIVGFGVALIFVFTPLWQLSIFAGAISGAFYMEMKKGVLAGSISVGLAWLVYIFVELSVSNIFSLFSQLSGIIIGTSSLGWVFMLIIFLVGLLFGVLGGAIGSGIRILVQAKVDSDSA